MSKLGLCSLICMCKADYPNMIPIHRQRVRGEKKNAHCSLVFSSFACIYTGSIILQLPIIARLYFSFDLMKQTNCTWNVKRVAECRRQPTQSFRSITSKLFAGREYVQSSFYRTKINHAWHVPQVNNCSLNRTPSHIKK